MSIQELFTIKDIEPIFENATASSLFILDVDDTLITPKDKTFRYADGANPHQKCIDDFKKEYGSSTDPKTREYFIKTLANWRLQRKCQLVEDHWPQMLDSLLSKGATVIGLTQMDVGSFGPIPSMEDWRYNELSSFGLRFTERFHNQEEFILTSLTDNLILCPRFKKGIIYTPKHPKGDVLEAFLNMTGLTPNAIFAFDDRPEHLHSKQKAAEKRGIPYQGYFYKAAQRIPGVPDPVIAKMQVEHLLQHSEWLSDEDAEKRLGAK